jgi:hypothetical protein
MTQQHKNGDTSPSRVDLRDTFAAAALTGILANPHDDLLASDDSYATMAYELADAMLRERLRQFDRSQPIKPAEDTHATHATPCEGSLRGEGTLPNSYRENDEKRGASDTKRGRPVAWAVVYPTGDAGVLCFFRRDAEDRAAASDRVVPLYRSPALTDEEREAIGRAIATLDGWQRTGGYHSAVDDDAATLRSLLARLA